MRVGWLWVLLAGATGCGDDGASGDAGIDAGLDAGDGDAGVEDAGAEDAPPPWPAELPPAGDLGAARGFTALRTIIHLHSPLSHDACDGEGWVDGALADPECLDHLRQAICRLRIDAVLLTDHAPHVNEVALEEALWMAAGDTPITNAGGDVIGARWACPTGGHEALVTVGSENPLMPVMLERHVLDTTDPMALEDAYDADGPDAVAAFRAAGALVFVPHTEQQTLDHLRGLGIDGVEIFNTHATVAPDIRAEFLGLPSDFLGDLLLFARAGGPPPDLAFITFFAENTPSLARFDELLAEGQRVMGIAGNDAHENTLTQILPDGERGDSYRRMMRWSSNILLVNERTLDGVREALLAARGYVAFEAFGTPIGFDFQAASPVGAIFEQGEQVATGSTLTVVRPSLPLDHPRDPPPVVRLRILRAAPGGAVEVAAGSGPTLTYVANEPGAYRAEARITPEHFRPYLSARLAERLLREQPWVYSNAIHVQAP